MWVLLCEYYSHMLFTHWLNNQMGSSKKRYAKEPLVVKWGKKQVLFKTGQFDVWWNGNDMENLKEYD